MTEDRVPYNTESDKANYQEIALVLNQHLQPELFLDVQYPEELIGDYKDFSPELKAEWYHYTYNALFGLTGIHIAGSLGRQLNKKELLFISGRLEAFIKSRVPG